MVIGWLRHRRQQRDEEIRRSAQRIAAWRREIAAHRSRQYVIRHGLALWLGQNPAYVTGSGTELDDRDADIRVLQANIRDEEIRLDHLRRRWI